MQAHRTATLSTTKRQRASKPKPTSIGKSAWHARMRLHKRHFNRPARSVRRNLHVIRSRPHSVRTHRRAAQVIQTC
eukprot:8190848-Pyramimonas_sp.AAC.1